MKVQPLFAARHHPVVVRPTVSGTGEALREVWARDSAAIAQLLLQHGAVLFRDFQIDAPADLKGCAESIGAQPLTYVGGNSLRSRISLDVYTSTESPQTEVIGLHNEMSYLPRWPRRVFFSCVNPAAGGGQTALAHGRDVTRALSPEVISRFREKKVAYIRNFHPNARFGRSWQETYWARDRSELESVLAELGSTCRWSANGSLRVTTVCDALTKHPVTGDEVWFNQAQMYHPSTLDPQLRARLEQVLGKGQLPYDCEYGDGDAIEDEVLAEIRCVLARCKLLFDWQRGDVLIIDNILMMHGRESFLGERTVLVYLSST